MNKNTLFVVMPAYNEEANIENVVESWYSVLEGKNDNSKLIIADSGSTDKTHCILTDMQKKYPKIEILSETNRYHGPKVIALYKYAVENGADYIFQTDSDGQTEPSEFEAFWNLKDQYDGIFGYRADRGDGRLRAFVEKVVCMLLKIYFGVNIPDANAPFRLMNTGTVAKYLSKLKPDYNLPNIMMTTYFVYYHESTAFRRISFKPRQAGVNSVNIPGIIKTGWKALHDFKVLKQDMV